MNTVICSTDCVHSYFCPNHLLIILVWLSTAHHQTVSSLTRRQLSKCNPRVWSRTVSNYKWQPQFESIRRLPVTGRYFHAAADTHRSPPAGDCVALNRLQRQQEVPLASNATYTKASIRWRSICRLLLFAGVCNPLKIIGYSSQHFGHIHRPSTCQITA